MIPILPKKPSTWSLLSFLIVSWMLSVSCTEQAPIESGAVQNSIYVIDTLRTSQNIPGLQVAVWQQGEIVFSEGFGFADLEQNVPMTPNTKMRIGSVSKTLTSAAVGKLYEEGRLDLDAAVQDYVTYFPGKKYPITIRQIAGHTAGIRHYRGEEFLRNERFNSVRESLEIFNEDTLLFEPGKQYSYSSYGWNLISAAVEEVTSMPFLSYMMNEVFNPLGMEATVPEYPDSVIASRTRYYAKGVDGEIVNAPRVDNSYKWAGGGFLGTAEDLIAFGKGIFWEEFLQPASLTILTESQVLDTGEKTNYGIGWRIGTDNEGRIYYGHSGGSVGGTTQFVVFPEQGLIIAMIANIGGISYGDVHLDITGFFIDEASAD